MSQVHQEAVAAALADDWPRAHNIVMQYNDPLSCWIHAVRHKIEGDADHSRYWYAQTKHEYADFADPSAEWVAIGQAAEEA